MKSLLLVLVLMSAGNLFANLGGNPLCILFESKTWGPIYVTDAWTPYVQEKCDEHRNADGTYDIKFCSIMDFNPNGSVELKELYVEGFRSLCPPVVRVAEKEEPNWFIQALIDFGNTPRSWRR